MDRIGRPARQPVPMRFFPVDTVEGTPVTHRQNLVQSAEGETSPRRTNPVAAVGGDNFLRAFQPLRGTARPQQPQTHRVQQWMDRSEVEAEPVLRTVEIDGHLTPLSQLIPYCARWTIIARCTAKTILRKFSNARGEGKLFSFDLLDAEDGEMRCTGFNDAATVFFDLIETGRIYKISKADVMEIRNLKFKTFDTNFELRLNMNSVVERVPDDAAITPIRFTLHKFKSIESIGDMANNATVDVIGVVDRVDPVRRITKKNGDEVDLRKITIRDQSNCSIEVTMWDDLAISVGQDIEEAQSDGQTHIVSMSRLRIGEFNGRSLSTQGTSRVEVDPEIPEKQSLLIWAAQNSGRQGGKVTALSQTGTIRLKKRSLLGDIHINAIEEGVQRGFYCVRLRSLTQTPSVESSGQVAATVTNIKTSRLYYASCPLMRDRRACMKKLVEQSSTEWMCEKCGEMVDEPQWRYLLDLRLTDHCGSHYVTAFSSAEQIIGMTANELRLLPKREQERRVEAVCFSSYLFSLRANVSTWQGDKRLQIAVLHQEPLNYVEETKVAPNSAPDCIHGRSSSVDDHEGDHSASVLFICYTMIAMYRSIRRSLSVEATLKVITKALRLEEAIQDDVDRQLTVSTTQRKHFEIRLAFVLGRNSTRHHNRLHLQLQHVCAFSSNAPCLTGVKESTWIGRKLLSSSKCRNYPEWIENGHPAPLNPMENVSAGMNVGGVALHFAGVLYLFLGIAIVCDEFFVGSLEKISEALGLSDDVAGATFMAAGSSAPELFSSLMALTNDDASNDIGVGTIVGSAIFNILVIIGVTALFSGRTLHLDYRPLTRDAIFYAAAIFGVIGIFHDGRIHWWEGLVSVLLYGVYIIMMKYNQVIMKLLPEPSNNKSPKVGPAGEMELTTKDDVEERNGIPEGSEQQQAVYKSTSAAAEMNVRVVVAAGEAGPSGSDGRCSTNESESPPETNSEMPPLKESDDTEEEEEKEEVEDDKDSDPYVAPKKFADYPIWLLSLPWSIAFTLTVPQCQSKRFEKWYPLTFMNSILWIGAISWFMVAWAADIGCVLGIPSAIMGVTVLAAGTSIPDALSSIVVAKEGKGDMAVANAVGSNVFDIWLGLGLPWMIAIPFTKDGSDSYGPYIKVDNDELLPNVLILFGVLILYLASVILAEWKLFPMEGYIFMTAYVIYAAYNIVCVWILDIYNTGDDDD